jgi:hypothetical protein
MHFQSPRRHFLTGDIWRFRLEFEKGEGHVALKHFLEKERGISGPNYGLRSKSRLMENKVYAKGSTTLRLFSSEI